MFSQLFSVKPSFWKYFLPFFPPLLGGPVNLGPEANLEGAIRLGTAGGTLVISAELSNLESESSDRDQKLNQSTNGDVETITEYISVPHMQRIFKLRKSTIGNKSNKNEEKT